MSLDRQVPEPPTPQSNAQGVERTTLVPFSKLRKFIPNGRNGKPRHVSTIFRYHKKGIKGVRLAATRLPDGLYTTLADWDRFVEELTALGLDPKEKHQSLPRTRSRHHRHDTVESEIERIRGTIRSGKGGGR